MSLIDQTLWEATSGAGPDWPRLQGSQDCEIAIIGAGIAGLSLALHLADRGLKAVVIEAEAEAAGAAGRSAGVVAPQLVRQTPDSVARLLGAARAGRVLRLVAEGGRHLFRLIGERQQECGATERGFLAPIRGEAGAARVAAMVTGWQDFRNDLRLLASDEIEAMTGCVGYRAALFDPTGGSVNPLAYARMLAQEAVAMGATLFTGSPVRSVRRQNDRWLITCPEGNITARLLVACANLGNQTLHPALERTVLTMPVCQIATDILSAEERSAILPGAPAMTDLEPDVLSLRLDPSGRLVTAYPLGRNGHRSPRLAGLVNQRVGAALPHYRPRPLAYAWTGIAVLNPTFLPRFFGIDENFYALQACNGRGLALNSVLGRELAGWIAEGRRNDWALAVETPRPVSGYLVAQYLPQLLMGLALMRQSLLGRLRRD